MGPFYSSGKWEFSICFLVLFCHVRIEKVGPHQMLLPWSWISLEPMLGNVRAALNGWRHVLIPSQGSAPLWSNHTEVLLPNPIISGIRISKYKFWGDMNEHWVNCRYIILPTIQLKNNMKCIIWTKRNN